MTTRKYDYITWCETVNGTPTYLASCLQVDAVAQGGSLEIAVRRLKAILISEIDSGNRENMGPSSVKYGIGSFDLELGFDQ